MTPEDLERYARHIVLKEIGGAGQARLRAATVAVVGAGGLGAPVILYLAAAGVNLRLVDDDSVDLSNLQRQIVHRTADVGRRKVEAAAAAALALNPGIAVERRPERLTEATADALLAGADVIVDGSDGASTRAAVGRAAVRLAVPLVSGGIAQWDGHVGVFRGRPCYACAFPEAPDPALARSCAEAGVTGPLAGIVGSMMANEAVKLIARAGRALTGRLMLYDALEAEARTLSVRARPDCPVCA